MRHDPSIGRRALLASALTGAAASFLAGKGQAQTPSITRTTPLQRLPLKTVRTSLLDVAYAEAGPADGKPVLLLHGWPYDIHTYADVAPRLADAGYRVIIPYSRGYGPTRFLSDATPRNAQPAALAVDALELIDALGLKQPIIGGCDWGCADG